MRDLLLQMSRTGLCVYLWASEDGVPVYEKYGFVDIDLGDLHINTGHEDDNEWMEVAR
jgi:hypothetical protein